MGMIRIIIEEVEGAMRPWTSYLGFSEDEELKLKGSVGVLQATEVWSDESVGVWVWVWCVVRDGCGWGNRRVISGTEKACFNTRIEKLEEIQCGWSGEKERKSIRT